MPLTNVKGVHVEKYRHFKSLLNHNHSALSSIAAMEQLYHSVKPFGLSAVRTAYSDLLEAVFGVIHALEAVSLKKYPNLEHVADEIDITVSEEMKSGFTYSTSDIVLPFEHITPELRSMVGAKAANLALIKNINRTVCSHHCQFGTWPG